MAASQEVLTGRDAAARVTLTALGLWLAVAGWAAMTAMWVTGAAGAFGHDQEGTPAIVGALLYLVGWLVMVAGMMLPSTLPTLRLVDRGLPGGDGPWFLLGYFSAWGLFGLAAYAGDALLHLAADQVGWLAARPELIIAGAALLAGGAEVVGRPVPPRLPSVGPRAGALEVGRAHAADRIRRCWPLMLFAMAIGMEHPVWMIALTGAMLLELWPRAEIVLRALGGGLLGLGVAVLVRPDLASVVFS